MIKINKMTPNAYSPWSAPLSALAYNEHFNHVISKPEKS